MWFLNLGSTPRPREQPSHCRLLATRLPRAYFNARNFVSTPLFLSLQRIEDNVILGNNAAQIMQYNQKHSQKPLKQDLKA